MRKAFSRLYDDYTGLALIAILFLGALLGGLSAYAAPEFPSPNGEQQPDPAAGDLPVPTAASNPAAPPDEAAQPSRNGEEVAGEPPPYAVTTHLVMTDTNGFTGSPVLSPDGAVFLLSLGGTLYKLLPDGGELFQLELPDKGAGTPAITGGTLLVLDRQGLNALDLEGNTLWRFEHETGTAVAGPVIGPEGNIYYTIKTGSRGNVQALSAQGEALWLTEVKTFSVHRPPLLSIDGALLFFKNEVYYTADGSAVDLQLDFKPDYFVVGRDGRLYMMLVNTLAPWTLSSDGALLAEDRFVSPYGPPQSTGVLADGSAWMQYLNSVVWFRPNGEFLRMAETGEAFLTLLGGILPDGTLIACGRNIRDFRLNAKSSCTAFSPLYTLALWDVVVGEALFEFSGALLTPGVLLAATEEGNLYRVEYEVERE